MRSRLALASLALLALTAAVVALWWAWPQAAGPARATVALDAAASPPPVTMVVVALEGPSERRVAGSWEPLRAGDRLSQEDQIRTGTGATVQLDTGAVTVALADRSQLTVGEISQSLARVTLGEGRLSALASKGARIMIAARASDAVAESVEGRFAVLSSGQGDVTVATDDGRVRLSAAGTSVAVGPGQQSTARPGMAPSPPVRIPPSLFLKVAAARAGHTRRAAVAGESVPGVVVSINGVRTAVDPAGRFTGEVALQEGANVIVVSVEDASGRQQTKVLKRELNTRGPGVSTKVTW